MIHHEETPDFAGDVTVKTQFGGMRLGVQIGILAILTFLGGYVLLFSDWHNDQRYVAKSEYQKDRDTDKELRTANQNGLNFRMEASDKKLDEIARDVKALLSRQPGN